MKKLASRNIILTLLQPYLNKMHTLYADNWYISPKFLLTII